MARVTKLRKKNRLGDFEADIPIGANSVDIRVGDGDTETDLESALLAIGDTIININSTIDSLGDSTDEKFTQLTEIIEVNVLSDDWDGDEAPFVQEVRVPGMKETYTFTTGILYPENCTRAEQKAINKAAGFLYEIDSGNDIVTFKATQKPAADIPLGLRGAM